METIYTYGRSFPICIIFCNVIEYTYTYTCAFVSSFHNISSPRFSKHHRSLPPSPAVVSRRNRIRIQPNPTSFSCWLSGTFLLAVSRGITFWRDAVRATWCEGVFAAVPSLPLLSCTAHRSSRVPTASSPYT